MNEATGKSVASFVKSICNSMTDKNQKALKSFADSMKELSIGTLYMAGSIALITATISMFGIMNVIEPDQQIFHTFVDKDTTFYIAIITTAVLLVLLTIFVKKTKIGIAMRAVSENE